MKWQKQWINFSYSPHTNNFYLWGTKSSHWWLYFPNRWLPCRYKASEGSVHDPSLSGSGHAIQLSKSSDRHTCHTKLQGQTRQDLSPVGILDQSVWSSNYALSFYEWKRNWHETSGQSCSCANLQQKNEENYGGVGKYFDRKTIWFRKSNKVAHNETLVCMPIYSDINLRSTPYKYK